MPVRRSLRLCLATAVALVLAAVAVVAWPSGGTADTPAHAFAARAIPVEARGPLSAALGRDDGRYRVAGGHAHNPSQRLDARFSSTGVTIGSGDEHVRLSLAGYGRAGALQPAQAARPRVKSNRVDYARGGLREWYANGPLGLEQGFDVAQRPATGRGPLRISLEAPAARRAHGAVDLGNGLRYGGLSASDARGRTLPSALHLRRGRIEIAVDDRRAAYPVRIDPFVQQAELTRGDGGVNDLFGASLAVTHDTIAVGAPVEQVGAATGQGAVHVFERPASGWANARETAKLTASDGAAGDSFGSVAMTAGGATIVVGAANHKVGDNGGQGVAYVFTRPGNHWADVHETARLTASDGGVNDAFGTAVGISGDTIVASAPTHKVGDNVQQGAAYVFVEPAAGWKDATQTATLVARDGATQDAFGIGGGVAIDGDTIVVGASNHDHGGNVDQGAVYVFTKSPTGWVDTIVPVELEPTDAAAGDHFGFAVSISGRTVAAGAPFHQIGQTRQGAAYVYVEPVSGWEQTAGGAQNAELTAADGATNDRFGATVGVSGDRVVVGALLHQVGSNVAQGTAYLFTKPPTVWRDTSQAEELTAADGTAGDFLGDAVAISGNAVAASAPIHTVGTDRFRGKVYVFSQPPAVAIAAPANGATYTRGQRVAAAYACSPAPGERVTGCAGPVGSGAPVDTSGVGAHSFRVTATDGDGVAVSRSVSYTVVAPGPSITRLRQSARVWRRGRKLARAARRHRRPVGTTFSFRLNERAGLKFSFSRLSGRHKRRPAGSLRVKGRAGANRVRFEGRLSRKGRLRPGRYTMRITATDSGGRHATSRRLSFTIAR